MQAGVTCPLQLHYRVRNTQIKAASFGNGKASTYRDNHLWTNMFNRLNLTKVVCFVDYESSCCTVLLYSLTLSLIQHMYSRRLSKHCDKNLKNVHKRQVNCLIKLKTLQSKEKLLIVSNFTFGDNVFKSRLLLLRGKGLRKSVAYLYS